MTKLPTTPRLEFRPADQRGSTNLGWLDSKHSFSFGGYHHPQRMGYHGLRVLNDDRVAPGAGFGTHPHRDMEILTLVLDGELAHKDSTPGSTAQHASSLAAGGVQLMSAGTGIEHSEFNGRDDAPVHFLQIWIAPRFRGAAPRYQEATPDPQARAGRFAPLATPDGRDGSLILNADAEVYLADVAADQTAELALPPGKAGYVHLATGQATVNNHPAAAGDAVTIEVEPKLSATGHDSQPAQVLAFVLPT